MPKLLARSLVSAMAAVVLLPSLSLAHHPPTPPPVIVKPTKVPTKAPTVAPTPVPTTAPTVAPTVTVPAPVAPVVTPAPAPAAPAPPAVAPPYEARNPSLEAYCVWDAESNQYQIRWTSNTTPPGPRPMLAPGGRSYTNICAQPTPTAAPAVRVVAVPTALPAAPTALPELPVPIPAPEPALEPAVAPVPVLKLVPDEEWQEEMPEVEVPIAPPNTGDGTAQED